MKNVDNTGFYRTVYLNMSYVQHDPNEYNPGCFAYFIWFATAIISLCMAFVHPVGAFVFFIVGIWIAGSVAKFSNTPEAYERMLERGTRPQRPAEMVYRREVTVSETVYAAPSYRPRTNHDREFLEGIFRPLE